MRCLVFRFTRNEIGGRRETHVSIVDCGTSEGDFLKVIECGTCYNEHAFHLHGHMSCKRLHCNKMIATHRKHPATLNGWGVAGDIRVEPKVHF